MRRIDHIVLHCTATPSNTSIDAILKYWRDVKGWKNPGYHIIIMASGEAVLLLPIDKVSNGVKGHNANGINIAYIGGIDDYGDPCDNRTEEQKTTMLNIVNVLKVMFPNAEVKGHRDFPGVRKACPSFDVKQWLNTI